MPPLMSLWEAALCCALVLEAQASAQEPTPQHAPQQQRQQQRRQPAAHSKGQTAAPKLSIEHGADAPPMLLGGWRTAASDEVLAGSKGKRGGRGGGQRRVLDVPLLLPVVVASAAGLPLLVRRVIR
jgi:hypothetical protein